MTSINRRNVLGAVSALAAAPSLPTWAAPKARTVKFPQGFQWGAATAGHQIEGQNTNSDIWLLEHVKPTLYKEPSGDACNSLALWPQDLDMVKRLNLTSYRFSIEWSRIEPEQGHFSIAALDHYRRMLEGCRARGIRPMLTFNHWSSPRWFAALSGWLNPQAPTLFARYCERATRALGELFDQAATFNEPNMTPMLASMGMPAAAFEAGRAMLGAAAKALGAPRLAVLNTVNHEDRAAMQAILIEAHHLAYQAIKSVRPATSVGVTLTMTDDQAAPGASTRLRDEKRAQVYGAWFEAAKQAGDFLGVQNYERAVFDDQGLVPPAKGVPLNDFGAEIYPASLGNSVRYAHEATGLPIIVTENGLCTNDDKLRAAFIPAALQGLHAAIQDGVPVKGYFHWSLIDNFEWVFGYEKHYGLATVDLKTFQRTLKPSAQVLAAIAARNAI